MAMMESMEATRRRHIIDCTIRVIARDGLTGTSLSRVAREAKVAKGIICYYFGNKDGLFAAVMERLRERTFLSAVKRAESRDEAWERIAAFVCTHLQLMRDRQVEVLAMRHLAESDGNGQDEDQISIWREQSDWLAETLKAGQLAGDFKQFDAHVVAGAISGAIDSGLARLAHDPEFDLNHCSAQLLALLEPGVRGANLPDVIPDASLAAE